jgi:hypothetical protein
MAENVIPENEKEELLSSGAKLLTRPRSRRDAAQFPELIVESPRDCCGTANLAQMILKCPSGKNPPGHAGKPGGQKGSRTNKVVATAVLLTQINGQ